MDRGAWWANSPWGHIQSDTSEATSHACKHARSLERWYSRTYLRGGKGDADRENRLDPFGEGERGMNRVLSLTFTRYYV